MDQAPRCAAQHCPQIKRRADHPTRRARAYRKGHGGELHSDQGSHEGHRKLSTESISYGSVTQAQNLGKSEAEDTDRKSSYGWLDEDWNLPSVEGCLDLVEH